MQPGINPAKQESPFFQAEFLPQNVETQNAFEQTSFWKEKELQSCPAQHRGLRQYWGRETLSAFPSLVSLSTFSKSGIAKSGNAKSGIIT